MEWEDALLNVEPVAEEKVDSVYDVYAVAGLGRFGVLKGRDVFACGSALAALACSR